MRGAVDAAREILERAIAGRVVPAASVDAGSSAGSLWTDALGTLTFDSVSQPATIHTSFDLASLTKVIATTTLIMELVRTSRVRVDEWVWRFFDEWRGADRDGVTVRDLLEHTSGLAARLVDPPPLSRREFEHEICRMRLEYVPRTQALYSDLDFILLGLLAVDAGGASLPQLLDRITARLKPDTPNDGGLTFGLVGDAKRLAAPTRPPVSDPRRGRILRGEVHDDYAAALGGVAGNAGLFGTASAVGAFARAVLRAARGHGGGPPPLSPELVAQFTTRSEVPGNSRSLGWDTMLLTSSCGTRMSRRAFGHVGFTGTSLWIDPERDRYFVLLTNRAWSGASLEDMRTVRRAFHDALGGL